MTEMGCFLAGLIHLSCPLLLMILWYKKCSARIQPDASVCASLNDSFGLTSVSLLLCLKIE